jgi:hypothetical protein
MIEQSLAAPYGHYFMATTIIAIMSPTRRWEVLAFRLRDWVYM